MPSLPSLWLLEAAAGGFDPVFAILAVLAIATSLVAVTRRNPLYGAAFLIAFFLVVAALFFRLAAPFLGIMQVLIYAGAIMVLYTFIIMLLDLSPVGQAQPRAQIHAGAAGHPPAHGTGARRDGESTINLGAFIISMGVFLLVAIPVALAQTKGFLGDPLPAEQVAPGFGSAEQVGLSMFTEYALPFEIVGLLLLVAAISGVVLAKRSIADQAEDLEGVGRGLGAKPAAAAVEGSAV